MADLRHLRAFVAVAEELNFTRAAERLHLAQQAVSKSVAALEDELGVALLERTTHRVNLTAAGDALLHSGREVLTRVESAFAEAQAIGGALTGSVQIGLTPAVGTVVRGDVVKALTLEAPDLSITFREVRPAEAEQALRRGEADLVISRTPPSTGTFDSTALAPSRAKLVVAAGHRLASGGVVPISALDGERLQTWNPRGHPYTESLVDELAQYGAEVEVVLAQVIGGGGPPVLSDDEVSLLPDGWPTAEGTVGLALEPEVHLPLWLLWPQGSAPAVVARIRSHMGDGPGGEARGDR